MRLHVISNLHAAATIQQEIQDANKRRAANTPPNGDKRRQGAKTQTHRWWQAARMADVARRVPGGLCRSAATLSDWLRQRTSVSNHLTTLFYRIKGSHPTPFFSKPDVAVVRHVALDSTILHRLHRIRAGRGRESEEAEEG